MAVEVGVGEVAHAPALGGQPVAAVAVVADAVAGEVGGAVVLDADLEFLVAQVEAEVADLELGFGAGEVRRR